MIHVEVTADDIAHGELRNCMHCPVALAFQRAIGDPRGEVTDAPGDLHMRVGPLVFRAPDCVVRFVGRFDEGERGEPFAFDLPDLGTSEWQGICRVCDIALPRGELVNGECEDCRA